MVEYAPAIGGESATQPSLNCARMNRGQRTTRNDDGKPIERRTGVLSCTEIPRVSDGGEPAELADFVSGPLVYRKHLIVVHFGPRIAPRSRDTMKQAALY